MRHSDGLDAFQRSSGCAYWGSISLPVEAVASAGATLGGCDLAPPKDPLTVTPTLCAMAKLQRLHAAAGVLAEDTPEIIAHHEAAHGSNRR